MNTFLSVCLCVRLFVTPPCVSMAFPTPILCFYGPLVLVSVPTLPQAEAQHVVIWWGKDAQISQPWCDFDQSGSLWPYKLFSPSASPFLLLLLSMWSSYLTSKVILLAGSGKPELRWAWDVLNWKPGNNSLRLSWAITWVAESSS